METGAAVWKRIGVALLASLALAAPATAVVEVPSGSSVQFGWAEASGDVAAYFVYAIDTKGRAQPYAARPASEPWTTLYGREGSEFALQVVAVSPDGELGPPSPMSDFVRFVSAEAPEPPPEEPPVEEPPVEEPPVEEPPVEEPPVEEPPVEEPGSGAPPHVEARAAAEPLDFDGDGGTEMLMRHETSGELAIWYVDGSTPVVVPVDLAPLAAAEHVVGNADYDGNGSADIAVRNDDTGELRVHFLETGSPVGMLAFADAGTSVIGSGDFDGDGAADLVMHDPGTGSVLAWPHLYVEGSDEVLELTTLATSSEPLGVADMDGDSNPDLLVRDGVLIRGYRFAGSAFTNAVTLFFAPGARLMGMCRLNGDAAVAGIFSIWGQYRSMDLLSRATSLPSDLASVPINDWLGGGQYGGSSHCDLLFQSRETGEIRVGDISQGYLQLRSLGTAPAGWIPVGVRYPRP